MLELNKFPVHLNILSKSNHGWERKMIHFEVQSHEFPLVIIESLWIRDLLQLLVC